MTRIFLFLLIISSALSSCGPSHKSELDATDAKKITLAELTWLEDYNEAVKVAKEKKKLLLVYFQLSKDSPAKDHFENTTLKDESLAAYLQHFVLLRLPVEAEVKGVTGKLIDHPAFQYMNKTHGYAILDYKSEGTSHYGKTISQMPFTHFPILGNFQGVSGNYLAYYEPWKVIQFRHALALPIAKLEVRSMVFAVRIHNPEILLSTQGQLLPAAVDVACDQSRNQSACGSCTHIGSKVDSLAFNGSASEIASPTYSDNLVAASLEAVGAWIGSPAHFSSMKLDHDYYGYCIDRVANGRWFATGNFAN